MAKPFSGNGDPAAYDHNLSQPKRSYVDADDGVVYRSAAELAESRRQESSNYAGPRDGKRRPILTDTEYTVHYQDNTVYIGKTRTRQTESAKDMFRKVKSNRRPPRKLNHNQRRRRNRNKRYADMRMFQEVERQLAMDRKAQLI